MIVTAKKNLIYDGRLYKRGEKFDCDEKTLINYGEFVTTPGDAPPADDLLIEAPEGLPPLDAPPIKRGKKIS